MLVLRLVLVQVGFAALMMCAAGLGSMHLRSEQIAFQSNRAGSEDIYLADTRTSTLINLTRSRAGNHTSPSWSPDGAFIAYEYAQQGTYAVSGIEIMRYDGHEPQRVYDGTASEPRWSPDGTQLTFRTADALHITIVSSKRTRTLSPDEFLDFNDYLLRQLLITHQVAVLPTRIGSIIDAQWSPGRQWITFTEWDGLMTHAYVMETACLPDCKDAAERFPHTESTRSVMLSANGQQIVFECRIGGYNGICVMQRDGTGLRQVVTSSPGTREISPVWRP
jgi:Tol biopolymer transport system component